LLACGIARRAGNDIIELFPQRGGGSERRHGDHSDARAGAL
jgi:hypothetical protein